MNIQTIKHVSDCVPLYLPQSLYLKPHAKFCISISLPSTITGKSISSFDAMENLRKMILPDKFSILKVSWPHSISAKLCMHCLWNALLMSCIFR